MFNKEEIKHIDGIEYHRWDDEPFWIPEKNGPALYICQCGSKVFNIFSPSTYTTRAKCVSCGMEDDIHTG